MIRQPNEKNNRLIFSLVCYGMVVSPGKRGYSKICQAVSGNSHPEISSVVSKYFSKKHFHHNFQNNNPRDQLTPNGQTVRYVYRAELVNLLSFKCQSEHFRHNSMISQFPCSGNVVDFSICPLLVDNYIAAEIHVQTVLYNFPVSRFLAPVSAENHILTL